jgi:hypothetical protein
VAAELLSDGLVRRAPAPPGAPAAAVEAGGAERDGTGPSGQRPFGRDPRARAGRRSAAGSRRRDGARAHRRPARRPGGAPSRGRAQWLAATVVSGAFVVGAAAGVAADRVWLGRQPVERVGWRDAFAADLALTPAQRLAVDSVLDARERLMDSLVAPVRPELDAVRLAARRQIRARLAPAQQARYDAYVARMAQRGR